MKTLRMVRSLAFMIPAWAMLGGFARLDSPGPGGVVGGMVVGGCIGVFFGQVFGGANGKWLDCIFGREQTPKDEQRKERFKKRNRDRKGPCSR